MPRHNADAFHTFPIIIIYIHIYFFLFVVSFSSPFFGEHRLWGWVLSEQWRNLAELAGDPSHGACLEDGFGRRSCIGLC